MIGTQTLLTVGAIADYWPAIRATLTIGLLAVLVYWTLRRLFGNGTDPNLSLSKSSDTGSTSVLVSGVDAVAVVALALVAVAYETVLSSPLLAAGLAGLVAVHWVYEKRERDGGIVDG